MGMFRTGGPGARGVSAFLIEPNLPGITVERVTEKLGIHTSNTCDLAFDGVELGEDALLGEEGAGFGNAMTALTAGRIGIAAQAIGILAACLGRVGEVCEGARCLRQADRRVRRRFVQGRADGDGSRRGSSYSTIARPRWPTRARVSRLPQARQNSSLRPPRESTPPRRCRSTAATDTRASFPVERHYRDAKITEIYEGTSEIQQLIIARSLLGRLE